MCLRTRQNHAVRAKKDITVYKVVNIVYDSERKHYFSPYHKLPDGGEWKLGEKCEADVFYSYVDYACDPVHYKYDKWYSVRKGLHSYADKDKAIHTARGFMNRCAVLECIIPHDTRYFVGEIPYSGVKSYCSDIMIPVKEVFCTD